jgi:peptide/nickel transport system ATP-binding protein
MTADAVPVLEIRNLTVGLPPGSDRSLAVENVSLMLRSREILCIVGESGSGKSVTSFAVMGLLASALKPIGGEIRFAGRDLLKMTDAELRKLRGRRLAMIFQEPMTALNPTMKVGRLIEETLRIHTSLDRRRRRARILELMHLVNIPSPEVTRNRYPHQLSGGQRQRIMIAMALALEPALLIADEPTTALDVTTQAQILKLIRDIQQRSDMAVLLVTHDFGVVADIADRVAVMQGGKIVEQGTVHEVLGSPQHPYTRGLLAAIPGPMNREPRTSDPQAATVLDVVGLCKTYSSTTLGFSRRQTVAVDRVDLKIRRGETLAVVGESGSGKSTMARCISGLLDATLGTIEIDGNDVGTQARRRDIDSSRQVQIVFQDPNRSLDPRWTIGASMIEGMRNIGIPKAQALNNARSLLNKVGLDPAALDRYPHEFSGGQRQRICIARALSMAPKLLIADEAVSALDVSVQAQVLSLMSRLQREMQLSMLFITHDLRVAAQISDRIAVMYQGKIVEQGPALEVFNSPQHAYSRLLFGSAPGQGRLVLSSNPARPVTGGAG